MKKETSSIQLPPPRRRDTGSHRSSNWLVWVVAALIGGIAAGLTIGTHFGGKTTGTVQVIHEAQNEQEEKDRKVEELLSGIRDAIDRADWVEIRDRYDELAKMDPEHPQLLAALPLIRLHMDEALGGLIVKTIPAGATVKLGSRGEAKSEAAFENIPFGTYTMEVKMEGYEPYVSKVRIGDKAVRELDPIQLVRSSGSLTLSSEPDGVEFQLIKTDGLPDPQEIDVIEIGKTPKLIEKLDPGEYEVRMALKGWPNYSENVSVEHNRKASVSHVFARGGLKITSDPDGAEILLTTETSLGPEEMGTTPAHLEDLPVGRHAIELHYADWPVIRRMVEVNEGEDSERHFSWPRAPITFTSDPPGAEILVNDRRIGGTQNLKTPFSMEFPEGEYTFVSRYEDLMPVIKEMEITADDSDEGKAVDFKFDYGSIVIRTSPSGASVIQNGVPLGRTPFSVNYVKPGTYGYQLTKPQHRAAKVSGVVNPGQSLELRQQLVFDPTPKSRSDFVNNVGLKMVWIESLKGWVGAYEVDQKSFVALMSENPSEFEGNRLPAHGVSWNDADKFCRALTETEQGGGRLPKGYEYRLPSDREWSEFVGEANLANAVTGKNGDPTGPSPVGSRKPNEYGLFDVRGNVWEWCDDWYTNSIRDRTRRDGAVTNPSEWVGTNRKVLRGGSWTRSSDNDLHAGFRNAYPPANESREVGFRVVLMPE